MYECNVALTTNDIYCSCEVIVHVCVSLVVSVAMAPVDLVTVRCHNGVQCGKYQHSWK